MEISVHVPELSKALQRVQGIVEKKSAMPALANALIRTEGKNTITVVATDLEIGVTGRYAANVAVEGSISLGARALYDIVRSLPEREVSLKQLPNRWVEISCGKVNYRLVGSDPDSFPNIPDEEDIKMFPVEPGLVRDMIEKTLYAVCTDETRYNLTGVFCEADPDGERLRMVATDGHRLSVIERPMKHLPQLDTGVIVPRKGLTEVKKLLEDKVEEASMGYTQTSAIFKKDGVTLTMRLVDGRFPDYNQVIPESLEREVVMNRQRFQDALRRTSLLSPNKEQGVKIELESGKIMLSANNPDLGEAREELEVGFEGDPITIGFNFRYLLDALSVLEDDEVVLSLTDELAPGVLTGKTSVGYKAVIMPMRI
ncbi:MAG: DNA polymerase III subunit beta [Myxococcales bacterium]|nr:DNA polymerase III subunit beta [Myxococcales bacterium]